MPRFKDFRPAGVIPATLLALNEDLSIDMAETRKHLADCALVDGVSAVTVNGHASEVHACTFDEQRAILAGSLEEVGDKVPLINGVYADGSIEAAKIARMSEEEGASCLLVFPPNSMAMGGHLRPEMAVEHYSRIAEATDLPIIAFQYPGSTGSATPSTRFWNCSTRSPRSPRSRTGATTRCSMRSMSARSSPCPGRSTC